VQNDDDDDDLKVGHCKHADTPPSNRLLLLLLDTFMLYMVIVLTVN